MDFGSFCVASDSTSNSSHLNYSINQNTKRKRKERVTTTNKKKTMENEAEKKWGFEVKQELNRAREAEVAALRYASVSLMESVDKNDPRPVIPLGHGDPAAFPCFRTAAVAEDAIVDSVRSSMFNCYAPMFGLPLARRAVAEYLNRDLPYKLSADDIYITLGCMEAVEIILTVITRLGAANILLPRPGWPFYESFAKRNHLEVRHFDLLPERGWEVDLEAVEALADENTAAIVIINPCNPCGNVLTYQHLQKIAETARKLGILVIADEVYGHLAFGSTPYIPMGVFGSIVPVITLGSISKRWIVPGWRFGWLATNDPNGVLQKSGIVGSIKACLGVRSGPSTLIQGAVPQILEKTDEEYFSKVIGLLRETADICYDKIKEIPCITRPNKPEGSMFIMVKLNPSLLEGINSDMEFAVQLAKEESVIVLPGIIVGMENWLRITFAIDPSALEDGLDRMKAFYYRHACQEALNL